MMRTKEQLKKQILSDITKLTSKTDNANNAYREEIKLRKLLKSNPKDPNLTKKQRHALAQRLYRFNHREETRIYNSQYYYSHRVLKRPCEHIAKIEINPNIDAVKLTCSRCGVLLAKC
jgi:hypothetical protein